MSSHFRQRNGSKPERLRSGSLQADLSLIVLFLIIMIIIMETEKEHKNKKKSGENPLDLF